MRLILRPEECAPVRKGPAWANIFGYHGSGKTITGEVLWKMFYPYAMFISRPNSRTPRWNDKNGHEYLFYKNQEYNQLKETGKLWQTKSRMVGGVELQKGTFIPELWEKPTPETKLIISHFGPTRSAQIQREFAPQMQNICLFGSELKQTERLADRSDLDTGRDHLKNNRFYRSLRIEDHCDYCINTDVLDVEQVAYLIAVYVGLEPAIAA